MKLKLDNDILAANFFDECRLLGIVAPMKDYKFIWYINNMLGMNMRLNINLEIPMIKKDRRYYFSVYEYEVPGSALTHYMYSNQYDGEYLLPEFKHLDFLWLTKFEYLDDHNFSKLLESVRKLPAVQWVSEMTNEKIKNKQHLIF